ncbi:MAG: Imm49 family immunity protein [Pseudomonadota bacterium]
MKGSAYLAKASKRIEHIQNHLEGRDEDLERKINFITHNLGDPVACVMGLSGHAEASAMYAWFANHDLKTMKQWWYVSAKLEQLQYRMEVDTFSPEANTLHLIKPILSDHDGVIDWFAHFDAIYDMKRVENHKTRDFRAYNVIMALRGDWPRLIERCERVINDPPGASDEQKYQIDHHFFLALGKGDLSKMEQVLQQIVEPKAIRSRSDDESGYTEDLISTYAVIYAKIAWRHGYQVKVDSPYVPVEWLPMAPLEHYDSHYDFLKS